jgi:L-fuculose-phosphate aldolase
MGRENFNIKEEICEIGKLMYDRGYVVSNDGNISVKVSENEIIITPSGISKGRMTPDMMVKVDGNGNILEGNRYPSSEMKMHLAVYRERPDIYSVIHAHPPVSTAFAVCRKPLDRMYMPETVLNLGPIPVTEYALPSTQAVPDSLKPFVHGNGALIANHGVIVWARDLWGAFHRMETVEHTARIYINVKMIGNGWELSEKELEELYHLSGYYKKLAGERRE